MQHDQKQSKTLTRDQTRSITNTQYETKGNNLNFYTPHDIKCQKMLKKFFVTSYLTDDAQKYKECHAMQLFQTIHRWHCFTLKPSFALALTSTVKPKS